MPFGVRFFVYGIIDLANNESIRGGGGAARLLVAGAAAYDDFFEIAILLFEF